MVNTQNGGTLLDVANYNGYASSPRLSIKVNYGLSSEKPYNLSEVNAIDELQFLDKETGMKIDDTLEYVGFIIWGILDFNNLDASGRPKYYKDFCMSTARNYLEAFRSGTVILRCSNSIDSKLAYGEIIHNRFHTGILKSQFYLENSFIYKEGKESILEIRENQETKQKIYDLLNPVHARVFESVFYRGKTDDTTTTDGFNRNVPDNGFNRDTDSGIPDTENLFVNIFRQRLRDRGYELLLTGVTRDRDRRGGKAIGKNKFQLKSGIFNGYYYEAFCFGTIGPIDFDMYHRSSSDDLSFLKELKATIDILINDVSVKENDKLTQEEQGILDPIILILNDISDTDDAKKILRKMNEIYAKIKGDNLVIKAMKKCNLTLRHRIKVSGKYHNSGEKLIQMLENLMFGRGIKNKECASMLEEYSYTNSSGIEIKLGENQEIHTVTYYDDNGPHVEYEEFTNYSQRYFINRSRETAGEIALDPPQKLIIRTKFLDCVNQQNNIKMFMGKDGNRIDFEYMLYLVDNKKYNISCPYNKIENPDDDHVYFIDFANNTQRDIMFDGQSKILNEHVAFVQGNCTIFDINIVHIIVRSIVMLYLSYNHEQHTINGSGIDHFLRSLPNIDDNMIQKIYISLNSIKEYLSTYPADYVFENYEEISSILTYLKYYTQPDTPLAVRSEDGLFHYKNFDSNVIKYFEYMNHLFELITRNVFYKIVFKGAMGGYRNEDSSMFRLNTLNASTIPYISHKSKMFYASQYFLAGNVNYDVEIFAKIFNKLTNRLILSKSEAFLLTKVVPDIVPGIVPDIKKFNHT